MKAIVILVASCMYVLGIVASNVGFKNKKTGMVYFGGMATGAGLLLLATS